MRGAMRHRGVVLFLFLENPMSEPFQYLDFDPNNLPDDYLKAIGLVAACSSHTESTMQAAIIGCLGIDSEYGFAVTTHMNQPIRVSVLRSAMEIRVDDLDELDRLDALLATIGDAFVKRNSILHDGWCRDPQTEQVYRSSVKARTSVKADLIPMSIDGIEEDATFIYQAGIGLFDFLIDNGLLPTIPEAVRPRAHKSKAARAKRRQEVNRGK